VGFRRAGGVLYEVGPTDGIFNIDKGLGLTSHDVVARVRRLLKQKRVGHAGTLDPLASGVLPILVGQATRFAEYLSESGKAYRALIRFGTETTTYDGEGTVVREAPVAITREQIEAALPEFLGEIQQVPPVYSAIKQGGQKLYELARAGQAVTPQPRTVRVDALRILSWGSPDLTLEIDCGKGTYIRSLAHDLGARLASGAYLAALVRWRSGPFRLHESISLEQLEAALAGGAWRELLHPPDAALSDFRVVTLSSDSVVRMRNGQLLSPGETLGVDSGEPGELVRAYATDGRFLGLLRWDDAAHAWQPHKVLPVDS
jgi:tRNA pseudouridine55 synthase